MSKSFAERRLHNKIEEIKSRYQKRAYAINAAFPVLLSNLQFINSEKKEEQIKELNNNHTWFLQQLEAKFNLEIEALRPQTKENTNESTTINAESSSREEEQKEAGKKEDSKPEETKETTKRIILAGR